MKIGQVIDNIFEDKGKSYKGTIDGFKYVLQFDDSNNKIMTKGPFGSVMENGLSDMFSKIEWELIQKPVTFMEVVESKELFKIDHPSFSPCYTNSYFNLGTFLDELLTEFGTDTMRAILTEGKFYIKKDN